MNRISIYSIIFLLISSIALSQELPKQSYSIGGECPYHYESYDIYNWDEENEEEIYYYNYGDSVPCIYDTKELRTELVSYIYQWIENEPKKYREADRHFYLNTINLRACYEFENCPDFALLKYEIDAFFSLLLYVGYVKSSGKWYPLSDGYRNTLQYNYNLMLMENPRLLDLFPVCLSALLIKLKYGYYMISVLDSYNDLIPSAMALEDYDIPDSLIRPNQLFLINISNDSLLMDYVSGKDPKDELQPNMDIFSEMHGCPLEDMFSLLPPEVKEYFLGKSVQISIYSPLDTEIATWRLFFSSGGLLLSIKKIKFSMKFDWKSSIDNRTFPYRKFAQKKSYQTNRDYFQSLQNGIAIKRQDTIISICKYKKNQKVALDIGNFIIRVDPKIFMDSLINIWGIRTINKCRILDAVNRYKFKDEINISSLIPFYHWPHSTASDMDGFASLFARLIENGNISIYDKERKIWLTQIRVKKWERPLIITSKAFWYGYYLLDGTLILKICRGFGA